MSPNSNSLYEFSDFRLDVKNGLLWRADETVPVKPKVIGLLQLLLQQPGEVLSKQQIMDELWPDTIVEEANLTQTMYLLRKALGSPNESQPLIETVPKIGYRWVGEVHTVTANGPVLNALPQVAAEVPAEKNTPAPSVLSAEIASPVVLPVTTAPPQPDELQPDELQPVTKITQSALPQGWWHKRSLALTALVAALLVIVAVIVFPNRKNRLVTGSVAVLPFSVLGTPNADPALSLGMADALITRLGLQNKVEIRPTAAIARFGDKQPEPLAAGKQLGVETVLTGYIQRGDGRLRVTAQLVRVGDGQTLWTETFDEKFTDLFTLEDQLVQQAMLALALPHEENWHKQMQDYGTASLDAWQHYQKGRYLWSKRQWAWTQKAIQEFEQALQLDPNYAQAHAGLADSYALWNPEMTPRERLAKAKPAVERALKLNDKLPEAHASLGFIKYKFEWDWRGAEGEFQKALALNANYATAHHWYGESLSLNGRHTEALIQLREAERLDPLSFAIKEDIGLAFYRARDFASAERKFREVLELDPNFFRTHHKLSDLLQDQGRFAEAFNENLIFWNGTKVAPDLIAALQHAFQQGGWPACARKELELIVAGKLSDDAHRRSRLSLRAGDREQALRWLAQSFDELGEAPLRINEPEFDALLNDPRFKALLHRAGHAR